METGSIGEWSTEGRKRERVTVEQTKREKGKAVKRQSGEEAKRRRGKGEDSELTTEA